MVKYEGAANLGTVVSVQILADSIPTTFIPAFKNFTYLLVKGKQVSSIDPQLEVEYTFLEENHNYVFKIGMVPEKIGVYRVIISDANNVYLKSDYCTKASFQLNFEQTNQHFYLFPGGASTPPGGNTYYFKVY